MASELVEPKAEEVVANACDALLAEFVTKSEPYMRKAADEVYEHLLHSVQDYLRDNANWNLANDIERCRRVERENYALRDQVKRLEARERVLVEALKPFAQIAGRYNAHAHDDEWLVASGVDRLNDLRLGQFRRAASALEVK